FILTAIVIILVTRRLNPPQIEQTRPPEYLDEVNLRPLFAPDEAELRELELEGERSAAAALDDEARAEQEKKLASFERFRQTWRESTNRTSTMELLRRASEIGSSEIYLETVDAIL